MPLGGARFNLYLLGLRDFVYHGVPKYASNLTLRHLSFKKP
jgi:hypothetical protein